MRTSNSNTKLNAARKAKNDEFYTQLDDVRAELRHYDDSFRGRSILLNCDNPDESNFWRYFEENFARLELSKLVATHHVADLPSFARILTPDGVHDVPLTSGDFRSPEVVRYLEDANIVVTNPPFSLFQEFIRQLIEYDKDFLVLGGVNAITNNGLWQLIQGERAWLGVTANAGEMWFRVPENYEHSKNERIGADGRRYIGVGVRWFTTLPHSRRGERIPLSSHYDAKTHPTYDRTPAIEVSRTKDIPRDYDGVMGVPITYLGRHNPEQFELVGCSFNHGRPEGWPVNVPMAPSVNGRGVYKRLYIRHRQNSCGLTR